MLMDSRVFMKLRYLNFFYTSIGVHKKALSLFINKSLKHGIFDRRDQFYPSSDTRSDYNGQIS